MFKPRINYKQQLSNYSKIESEFKTPAVFTSLGNYRNNSLAILDNQNVYDNEIAVLINSKYESENINNKYLTCWSDKAIGLPDIFNEDATISSITATSLDEIGITVDIIKRENLTFTDGIFHSFNYDYILTATTTTNIGTTIWVGMAVHPSPYNPNKNGKRVDLNILGWYLIFKLLGFNIRIASSDNNLLKSADTFNKKIIFI